MKLKNKKTGEIIEFDAILPVKDIAGDSVAHLEYGSLAELNEEWEDYKEPKGYWYYDTTKNGVDKITHLEDKEKDQAIGNYFDTREEAEKAVEKLKAWKRLKEKGFRFNGWNGTRIGSNISYVSEVYYEGCSDDMDLLFGDEE